MMKMKIFNGSQFRLRPWKMDDADHLVKHANNPKIAMNLRDGFPHPYTKSDATSWIEMIMNNRRDLVYAIEVNNEAAGGIGLHAMKDVYRYNAEIGFWLSEKYWGKGIMTEAVGLIVRDAFENDRWVRIYAGVFSRNTASMKVLEKNKFRREAVHHKAVKKGDTFMDEYIYARLKDD